MIPDIFAKVLSMSISAGWLIIGIIVLRLIFHRRSKWIFPVFWCLAGLRLIVPWSLEVETSLLPVSNYIDTAASAASSGRAGEMFFILSLIWCVGVAVMLLSAIVRYLRLRSKLKTAVLLSDNVYQTEYVHCPFITGILHPRIYAPFHIGDDTLAQAIAHEKAHIRRHDHWLKHAAYLVLAIHWFNPLVWAHISFLAGILNMPAMKASSKVWMLHKKQPMPSRSYLVPQTGIPLHLGCWRLEEAMLKIG